MLPAIVGSRTFKFAVIGFILLNAAVIGLETYPAAAMLHGPLLALLDRVLLAVFTIEIGLRFLAAESKTAFFRDPWQALDILVVAVGWVPAARFVTVFRLGRVLRILHSVFYMPNLQRIVTALFTTLPALSGVLAILGIIFYIYGVIGTYLFGGILPERFGTMGASFLTLFEIITLEGWSGLMRETMRLHPWAWVYFVSFILVGTFFALNAIVSVLTAHLSFLAEDTDLVRIEASLKRIEARLAAPGIREP
ncbi:MAG: ion transporter [Elusimicrobiota bacterium]|jgi:voltage-gated sodium channel